MRILAISDVSKWGSQKKLVDSCRPSVVVLAGDLTSDGFAEFWQTALEADPGFRSEKCGLRERLGVRYDPAGGYDVIPRKSLDEYRQRMRELEYRYRSSSAFLAARKKLHVDRFYDFLRYAGRVAAVLVVKGDHDDDFPGDYDVRRIERIAGCQEISGRTHAVGCWVFLGVPFDQAQYRRPLRLLISEYAGRVDVVIAHAPQKNVRLLAQLQPHLLIRGHFGGGRYLIDGVPSVFTSDQHAIIELRRTGVPRIRGAAHEFWDQLLRKDYDWLQPYPVRS